MFNIDKIKEYENKILNMDCIDFLKQCPDKIFDLVLTDPPYGINAATESFMRSGVKRKGAACEGGMYNYSDWDKETPNKEIFSEIVRISKHAIIFGGNYFVENLTNSSCWIVWDKHNGKNSYADCELAWTNFNTAVRKYDWTWLGMIQENMKEKEIRIHPTQKPVGLFMKILQDYSKENDLVLDCFSGSGTTAIACHNLKRRFICIEKDPEYYRASCERLEQAQRQQTLF